MARPGAPRVVVLGAGVSGLTCAVRLLEAGHRVDLWSSKRTPQTTSDVAAAFWYPFRAFPEDKVLAWGRRTYEALLELSQDPASGIVVHEALEVVDARGADPWWSAAVRDFRWARPDELPAGSTAGYVFKTPVVEMPLYLPWLERRVQALGGTFREYVAESLDHVLAETDADVVLVNCTGLGAREVVPDPSMIPIRGEVLKVEPPPRVALRMDENVERLAYVVPRSKDVVLGGTADFGNESLTPDPEMAKVIWERCERLVPHVRGARVLAHVVGLRPGRPEVRLEGETRGGRTVIHNYGHGGAGVTLSWGCAESVSSLARPTRS